MVLHQSRASEKRYFYFTDEDVAIAEKNGIKKNTLITRCHKLGWDIDRAITQPVTKKHKWWDEWCKFKDIASVGKYTFYSRKDTGWSTVRAALLPPLTKQQAAQKLRKYTQEQLDAAAKLGITRRLISYRTTVMKWPLEKALTTPKMSKKEAGKQRYRKKVNNG